MKSHKLTILMPNSFNSLSLITIGVCIKKKWAIYERIEKNYKVGLEKKKKKQNISYNYKNINHVDISCLNFVNESSR